MKRIVFTVLTILGGGVGYAESVPHPVYSAPGQSIIVSVHDPVVVITLQSNPTTGFSWFLGAYDKSLLKPLSHRYVAPKTKSMGAPGYEVWKFKVNKAAFVVPHRTEISMEYARPWVAKSDSSTIFTVVTK